MSYFSLYLDYFYPLGGVKKLADAINNKLLEFGGEIKTATQIVEVNAEESHIKDSEGNTYIYDSLIWAADLKTFYNITDAGGLSEKVRADFDLTKERMLEKREETRSLLFSLKSILPWKILLR